MIHEIVEYGTMHVKNRVLTDVEDMDDGFWLVGYSNMEFGFRHKWKVGPYPTIVKALRDWNSADNDTPH